jgi:hypothetical protein
MVQRTDCPRRAAKHSPLLRLTLMQSIRLDMSPLLIQGQWTRLIIAAFHPMNFSSCRNLLYAYLLRRCRRCEPSRLCFLNDYPR